MNESENNKNEFLDPIDQIDPEKELRVYRWSAGDEIYPPKNKKKKAGGAGIKIFAAIMAVMFLFCAGSTAYLLRGNMAAQSALEAERSQNRESPPAVLSNKDAVEETKSKAAGSLEDTAITIPENSNAPWLTTEEAIAKVSPAVVCIETETELSGGRFNRNSQPYIAQGVGTGFIVSEDGYIATNYHVVDGVDKITVTLKTGETYEAQFVGGDEVEDLAAIKIEARGLPVAQLGDSDALVQGQDVVAIGTPAGIEFAWSATKGIVSAINRTLDVNGEKMMTVIQTDASINRGNSGGPLINMKGQVVGINSLKIASTEYEGMGFAIPINSAIDVLNEIIANPGNIVRLPNPDAAEDESQVSFGLSGRTITAEESEYYGIPQGWKISEITEGGACDGSGLQPSDIIVALDGSPVESTQDMYDLKMKYKPGDRVTVTIYRNGDVYDFEVTMAAK
ncbi:MAG: trypsin-like peptidase domain-containing protein [Oscillospiraceae bacterium]|nr:trypsin-like peptidase domain-containing protein [Oscillospiraceae bacterium]